MNLIKLSLTVATVCFVIVLVLAVVAPIVIQDGANRASGNGDTALDNIRESIDSLNEKLDESAFGEWLNGLDS